MPESQKGRSATVLGWLDEKPGERGLRAWIDDVLSGVLTHAETKPDEWSLGKQHGIDLIQRYIESLPSEETVRIVLRAFDAAKERGQEIQPTRVRLALALLKAEVDGG